MLLRTEVIGLNAWLVSIRVPDILPRCDRSWCAQSLDVLPKVRTTKGGSHHSHGL
jgi:hypothetical protein